MRTAKVPIVLALPLALSALACSHEDLAPVPADATSEDQVSLDAASVDGGVDFAPDVAGDTNIDTRESGSPESSAASCIDSASPGDHEYTCSGIKYDVHIPSSCSAHNACGLIVDVHGFTMSGKMLDDNDNMRSLGDQHGYIVVQPNANPAPPSASWHATDDPLVYAFIVDAIHALGVNPKRVHMTGFSQGGDMTFRFLCKHADLFASVAPAAGVGCTFKPGDMPSREIPVLYMHGTHDALISFTASAIPERDAVVTGWSMGAGAVVAQGAAFTRTRYVSASGNMFEFLQHDFTSTVPILKGHCVPGSHDPGGQPGQLFSFACTPPNAFTWGDEIVKFFMAHESI